MLKIQMIDTTGRQPVTLAKFIASEATVKDGELTFSIPTQAQQTIARGKFTQHGVRYGSALSEFTVNLALTNFEFSISGE